MAERHVVIARREVDVPPLEELPVVRLEDGELGSDVLARNAGVSALGADSVHDGRERARRHHER
jgi:hypothetical protein